MSLCSLNAVTYWFVSPMFLFVSYSMLNQEHRHVEKVYLDFCSFSERDFRALSSSSLDIFCNPIGNQLCLSGTTVFVSFRLIEQPCRVADTTQSIKGLLWHHSVPFLVTYIWHLFLSLLFVTQPNGSWRVWFHSVIKRTSHLDGHEGPLTVGNHVDSSQGNTSS